MFKATSVIHFLPSHTNYYSFLWKVTLEGNSKVELDLPQVDCEMRDETRKARDEVPSRATKSRNASDEVARFRSARFRSDHLII